MVKRIEHAEGKYYIENGKVYPVLYDENGAYVVIDGQEREQKEEKPKKKGE